jgi:hypothetical protein
MRDLLEEEVKPGLSSSEKLFKEKGSKLGERKRR